MPNSPELTFDQLKSALEQEGLIFYPKRALNLPDLRPEHFTDPKFQNKVRVLLHFFTLTPIGDMWGSDDGARQVWESTLIEKYGKEALHEHVSSQNSFRGNAIGKVMWMSRDIRNMLGELGLADLHSKITPIVDRMSIHVNGGTDQTTGTEYEDYHRVDSLDTKIEIIQFLEDSVLEILQILQSGIDSINENFLR